MKIERLGGLEGDHRHMTPNFDDYADMIRSLPPDPEEKDVLNSRFLLGREARLKVYYAPLHGITASARVVIVGITPGRSQMLVAFQEAGRCSPRGGVHRGYSTRSAGVWPSQDR